MLKACTVGGGDSCFIRFKTHNCLKAYDAINFVTLCDCACLCSLRTQEIGVLYTMLWKLLSEYRFIL